MNNITFNHDPLLLLILPFIDFSMMIGVFVVICVCSTTKVIMVIIIEKKRENDGKGGGRNIQHSGQDN